MSRPLQNKEANLWPGAVLTLAIFTILIFIGLTVTFGVIQQLRYIAWEQQLRQAEQSLASEKKLFQLTLEFKKSLEDYYSQGTPVSIEIAQERYNKILQTLTTNPQTIKDTLTDFSMYNLSPEISQYTEAKGEHKITIRDQLSQTEDYYTYKVTTDQYESLILYTQSQYPTQQSFIITAFRLDQNLIE
jgi:hypothetical protein